MKKLTISEVIFIAVMGATMGIIWWIYTFVYDIFTPFLKVFAVEGILNGVWLMGGTFFGYVVRKPGSAILGEMMAAIVQGFISRWGISSLIYALVQGLPVEMYFLSMGYKKWSYKHMIVAGILAAGGGYAMTFIWFGYFHMNTVFNSIQLGCNVISGAIFPGMLAKFTADKMYEADVLNQFNIAKDMYSGK